MDKTIAALVLVAFSGWEGGVAAETPVRVTGEVVALQCYPRLGEDGRGPAHASCARHCAEAGSDLGVVTDEQLYRVTGEASVVDQMREHMAETVTVEGVATDRGQERLLEVRAVSREP